MVDHAYLAAWARAFAFTQLVEVPVHARALRGARPLGARVAVAFGASLITHPVVWFVLPHLGLRYETYVVVAELFAVLAEAAYLRGWGVRRALFWSLLANGASFALGEASRACFGLP